MDASLAVMFDTALANLTEAREMAEKGDFGRASTYCTDASDWSEKLEHVLWQLALESEGCKTEVKPTPAK